MQVSDDELTDGGARALGNAPPPVFPWSAAGAG
jgi:hypothetical protein